MNLILAKTFGGLESRYYFRHFVFGLLFPVIIFLAFSESMSSPPLSMILFSIISTFLYPYSRFVYEKLMSFIMGENVFFTNAILMLTVKFVTMYFCWVLGMFIAPAGLIFLYYHHTKNASD